jgi:hypothetical protein
MRPPSSGQESFVNRFQAMQETSRMLKGLFRVAPVRTGKRRPPPAANDHRPGYQYAASVLARLTTTN